MPEKGPCATVGVERAAEPLARARLRAPGEVSALRPGVLWELLLGKDSPGFVSALLPQASPPLEGGRDSRLSSTTCMHACVAACNGTRSLPVPYSRAPSSPASLELWPQGQLSRYAMSASQVGHSPPDATASATHSRISHRGEIFETTNNTSTVQSISAAQEAALHLLLHLSCPSLLAPPQHCNSHARE